MRPLLCALVMSAAVAAPAAAQTTFTLMPSAMTHAWRNGQIRCVPFELTNTGNMPIVTLDGRLTSVSSSGLRANREAAVEAKGLPLPAGKHVWLTACMPLPAYAGTYSGTIAVTANAEKTERIALTMTTRGPTFGSEGLLWLPFALFSTLLAVGFCLSWALESWFSGGGLARAEAAIALAELAAGFRTVRSQLTSLATMVRTDGELQLLTATADNLRLGRVTADLGLETVRLTCALQGAQWAHNMLDALDAVRRPAAAALIDTQVLPRDAQQLATYRTAVENAVTTLPAAAGAPGAGGAGGGAAVSVKPAPQDPEVLQRRIHRMAWLQRLLIWSVAAAGAYMTLYAGNAAFGTLTDYIAVFVWALGLTQAGTQVVAQARFPGK